MNDITKLGQNIAIPHDMLKDGVLTHNSWQSDQIFVIKMRDGSFVLGTNILYINEFGRVCKETYRIYLDENNDPFVVVGALHDFTVENCENDIISKTNEDGSLLHIVQGMPMLTISNDRVIEELSVFAFTEESKTLRYFSAYGESAHFNKRGLALMVRFVEHPGSKEFLEERTSVTTAAELEFLSKEMKFRFDRFLKGEIKAQEMSDLCKSFEQLRNKSNMDKNTIGCDLSEIESFFIQEDAEMSQPTEDVEGVESEEIDDELEEEYEYETETDDDVE